MPSFMERNPELRDMVATSGVTTEQFASYTEKVLKVYATFAVGLPDDSAWKDWKAKHAAAGAHEAERHAELFGFNSLEVAVIAFTLSAHDSGRLVDEHVRRATGCPPARRHGELSAIFAETIFEKFAKTPLAQAVLIAIVHHSDNKTPTLDALGGNRAAHALTGLIRDLDKISSFDVADRYVNDEVFKRQRIETNFVTQRMTDPTWGDEKGFIVPNMLADFLAGKALNRPDCSTYETYIAQFLAWLFDIQNDEVLEICVERGGPKCLFRYLIEQLMPTHAPQAMKLAEWAKSWKDGLLLRA